MGSVELSTRLNVPALVTDPALGGGLKAPARGEPDSRWPELRRPGPVRTPPG